MIKMIEGYDGKYGVDELGNVYSYCIWGSHSSRLSKSPQRVLAQYTGAKSKYLMVNLCDSKHNKHNTLVHRLVAEAFIPNPDNLPEIDHIDDNPQNNKASNLQWVTRQGNIDKMLSHSTPVRNYKTVCLKKAGEIVGYFISQKAACRYASKHGASLSSLEKYKITQDWTVESVSTIPEGSSIRDENGCEVVPEFGIKH